jgi:hypothetical protein
MAKVHSGQAPFKTKIKVTAAGSLSSLNHGKMKVIIKKA